MEETDRATDYIIVPDDPYTESINQKVREKYGPREERNALHATDLIFCLRKAWAKKRIPADVQGQISDDTILTWGEGLMFEDLISTGERQKQAAYCFYCRTVNSVTRSVHGGPEPDKCSICRNPWVLFTPDYIEGGIIHEVKQTRKSSRHGPEGAPWWIDQLRTYLLFALRAGWVSGYDTRLIVNYLMGDYGSRKKGQRPRPPQSSIDVSKIVFTPGFESYWEGELQRRVKILLDDEMPLLRGMGREHGKEPLSPMYDWECASCPVGDAIGCEMMNQWTVIDEQETEEVEEGAGVAQETEESGGTSGGSA